MEKWDKIKVDKKVTPVHFKDRKPVNLIIGKEYFVSFGNNIVNRCTLIEIKEQRIVITIPKKPRSKKGFVDTNGSISHDWKSTHHLFADEIGDTPEQAVLHEVTL